MSVSFVARFRRFRRSVCLEFGPLSLAKIDRSHTESPSFPPSRFLFFRVTRYTVRSNGLSFVLCTFSLFFVSVNILFLHAYFSLLNRRHLSIKVKLKVHEISRSGVSKFVQLARYPSCRRSPPVALIPPSVRHLQLGKSMISENGKLSNVLPHGARVITTK